MPDIMHDYDPETDRFILPDLSPRLKDLATRIPGNRYADGQWSSPATLSAAYIARQTFGQDLQPTGRARTHVEYLRATEGWRMQMLGADPVAVQEAYGTPDTLLDFQHGSVSVMENSPWVFQFDERGNGKTPQACAALDRVDGPALVVVTASMLHTWAEEMTKHAPSRTPYVLDGNVTQRRKKIEAAALDPRAVLICTWKVLTSHTRLAPYGSVSLTEKQRQPKEFNGGWINHVVADEAHYAKNPKAERTRALWAVGHEATGLRIPMTATPIANSAADVWSLLHFVDPDSWPSRGHFRDRYVHTVQNGWGGLEDLGFRADTQPELMALIGPRMIRRPLQAKVLELPPQTRWLDLTPKQKKAYKAMQEEMLAELDSGVLTASSALVRDMRLHQIAAATPVIEEYEEPDPETGELVKKHRVSELVAPSNKLDALWDLLDEQGEDDPLVVFAESRKLIEMFYRELTKGQKGLPEEQVGLITGLVENETRAAQVRAFQNGEQRLMLLTIAAGREGITLTRSNTLVFAQRSPSELGNIQAKGRVLRVTQERDVRIIDLVSRGTVEEKRHEDNADKGDRMQELLQDPDYVRHTLEYGP